MGNLREKIMTTLFEIYEQETANLSYACKKGCSTCCTQSVTVTATEGQMIIEFLKEQDRIEELHEILKQNETRYIPAHTPNRIAALYHEKKEVKGDDWDLTPCCFLDNNCCSIYPVRPFACRCFGSTVQCDLNHSAEQPSWLITLNTVMMQVVEHVGQGEYWGNMMDILLELSSQSRYIGRQWQGEGANKVDRARFRLLTAEPVSNFIVPPEDEEKISQLLKQISGTEVYKNTIGVLVGM